MAQQIKLEIIIDGDLNISSFISLNVYQRINDHHSFELRFSHEVKQGNDAITITKFQDYLGKQITITFGGDMYEISKNHDDRIFKGIITGVSMADTPWEPGTIILRGSGSSVLLDTIESCSTHLEKNLSQIVKSIGEEIPGNLLTTSVNPVNKATIPYLVQYNETDYDFLKRLAAEFGEWLVYDGNELHFGKPSSLPSVQLNFPEDVSDLDFSMRLSPANFKKNSYSLKKLDDQFEVESASVSVSGLGNFGDIALKSSQDVFSKSPVSPNGRGAEKSQVDDSVKIRKGAISSDMVVLRASSDNPGVQVGTIVDLIKEGSNLGKYLVIDAVHNADGNGNYTNRFKAIPSEVEILPPPVFRRVFVEPQIGKVLDNKDPDGKGRIKVQLMWQPDEDKSSLPWMQQLSPSAGGGGKNRGIHFTPELGDFVMVGFTANDPSQPFVMGSITSDDNRDSSPNKDNFEKSIITRSGNTIFFRDKENSKEQEIRVQTDDENYLSILLTNGDGTIEIKSNKKINISSSSTVNVRSGDISIKGTNIKMEASDSFDLKAKKITMKADTDLKAEGLDVDLKATTTMKIDGGTDLSAKAVKIAIAADAQAEIKGGATLDLKGGAMTNIKGGLVNIN